MTERPCRADLILRGGVVVDGSGAAARRADVAVRGERVAAVGELTEWSAEASLDVTGLVVAPGFIDMHSHSDLSLLINPRAESKIRQGVTTEVIGQCGFSPAPVSQNGGNTIRALFGSWGQQINWTWGSVAQYLDRLREQGVSVNVVPVVGHGIIRAGVVGFENRLPTSSELTQMIDAARVAMGEGAFGLSSGLVYVPGMFADTTELITLAHAIAPYKGIYFSHMRSEGDRLLESIAEVIRIGREAGVGVEISHLKAEGQKNWGKTADALAMIVKARESGLDVNYDCYPYTAWNTDLVQLLPAWAREGGPEEIINRLQANGTRAHIRKELRAAAEAEPGKWERRILASVETETNRNLQGLTIVEIATRRACPAEEVIIDLLLEEQVRAGMVGFGMCEEDVSRVISHPLGVIGSDAAAAAPYGELSLQHPHPRTYGTFPRVLSHYVREHSLLTLEEAIRKMTSTPAVKLGLTDRGRIAEGMAADLVVFDPNTIADMATYQEPHRYPTGIRYVIVNGVIEIDGDTHLGKLPGQVLSHN